MLIEHVYNLVPVFILPLKCYLTVECEHVVTKFWQLSYLNQDRPMVCFSEPLYLLTVPVLEGVNTSPLGYWLAILKFIPLL